MTTPMSPLFNLPQDIFRLIFQYLTVDEIIKGEEAFLHNQELSSLYQSSLTGYTLNEKIHSNSNIFFWIIDHQILVGSLELYNLREKELNVLNTSRSSLKSISFKYTITSDILTLGHFPSLTSTTFDYSISFDNNKLLPFFLLHPKLEIINIGRMRHLTNQIILPLSIYCPNLRILKLEGNKWVNDGTILLLSQGFHNLKSLDLRETDVRSEESLRQFILTHPHLSCLLLSRIRYTDGFLLFLLEQVIFPSILSYDSNSNNLQSHSLAISSLLDCFRQSKLHHSIVTPRIFHSDILTNLYHKECSNETVKCVIQVFDHLTSIPTMIKAIVLEANLISILFNFLCVRVISFDSRVALRVLSRCCNTFPQLTFEIFTTFSQRFQSNHDSLIYICWELRNHLSQMNPIELNDLISISFSQLSSLSGDSRSRCLDILITLLQDPATQHLINPTRFIQTFQFLIPLLPHFPLNCTKLFDCLRVLLTLNEDNQHLFINSNVIHDIIQLKSTSWTLLDVLIDFVSSCLLSENELLVDHCVSSGLFQYLVSDFISNHYRVVSLFRVLMRFKNHKYAPIVNKMTIPNELRAELFAGIVGNGSFYHFDMCCGITVSIFR